MDDHSLVRELLRDVCVRDLGYEVVAEAECGADAVSLIVRVRPDLVLLDLGLPDIDGFEVIDLVRRSGCHPRIVLLSGYCDDYTVYRVEHAGVQGFLDKPGCVSATLKCALAAVAQGRTCFSGAFCRVQAARRMDPLAFDKILSDSERRLLEMTCRFMTDREIAEQLDISVLTVEKHRFNLRHKLDVGSKPEMMRYGRDHGFMPFSRGSAVASGGSTMKAASGAPRG